MTRVATTGPFEHSHDCSAILNAGAICTITVAFTPTTTGAAHGLLSVSRDGGSASVELMGNGGLNGIAVTRLP